MNFLAKLLATAATHRASFCLWSQWSVQYKNTQMRTVMIKVVLYGLQYLIARPGRRLYLAFPYSLLYRSNIALFYTQSERSHAQNWYFVAFGVHSFIPLHCPECSNVVYDLHKNAISPRPTHSPCSGRMHVWGWLIAGFYGCVLSPKSPSLVFLGILSLGENIADKSLL